MTRDDIYQIAKEAGYDNPHGCGWDLFDIELFANLVAAAERAKMQPASIIVDVGHIDKDVLASAMKRARPVLVAGTPRPDEIAAAVAAEREACALMCEQDQNFEPIGSWCAHSIRARGQS